MQKINLSLIKQSSWIFVFLFTLTTSCNDTKKVACVGDSITEGAGIRMQSEQAYPVVLNELLGDRYYVLNAGRSATTLTKDGDFPYWTANEFSNVFAYQPDIIVIKLGTNDTKPHNWNEASYEKDYQALIDTFKTIPTNPEIYLCYPVPVFENRWGINDSTIVNGVIPAINRLSEKNQLPVLDLYHFMKGQGDNFPDHIHPNEKAAERMAAFVANAIQE